MGEECRITIGESKNPKVVPVKSYRSILHQYLYNPESKFNGPDGTPCDPWTRGVLQRRHVIAGVFNYCGKEMKRQLEQGPVDHEIDFKVKLYANGRVSADPETLRKLGQFSEREIARGAGLHRKPIHLFCSGKPVRNKTAHRIVEFISQREERKNE